MVKSKPLAAVIVAIIIAVIGYYFFYETEEDRIKKQFKQLESYGQKAKNEHPILIAKKSKQIQKLFSKVCQIYAAAYNIDKKIKNEDIPNRALMAMTVFKYLSISFNDYHIQISGDTQAEVNVTFRLTGERTSGELIKDVHELQCELVKNERAGWLFTRIESVDVLEK